MVLQEIIKNRVVCIMTHGASIEYLETYIEELRDKDICWLGLGLFTIFEDSILSKINKSIDIVFDCASVPESKQNHYETNIRLPRLYKFLSRDSKNMWVTTHGIIRDVVNPRVPDWITLFSTKILQVDGLFPAQQIVHYMDVPNSTTLAIATAMAGNAKKIILFGCDGWTLGDNNVHTYYKPELQKQERIDAYGEVLNEGLVRDTCNFAERFASIHQEYIKLFGDIPIVNCSPYSHYECIKRINYNQLKEEL